MYRYNDIEKIDKNIDTIIDDAAKQYKTLYEPTLKEIGEVYSFIIDYKKCLFIYDLRILKLIFLIFNSNK